MNSQTNYQNSNIDYHMWIIAIALPNAEQRTIARFCHLQDAEDRLRVLRRLAPKAQFEIVFNSPEAAIADNVVAQV